MNKKYEVELLQKFIKLLSIFILLLVSLIAFEANSNNILISNFILFLMIYSGVVFFLIVVKSSLSNTDILEPFYAFFFLYSAYAISAAGNIVYFNESSHLIYILFQYYVAVIIGLVSFAIGYFISVVFFRNSFSFKIEISNQRFYKWSVLLVLFLGVIEWRYALSVFDPRKVLSYTERISTLADASVTRGVFGAIDDVLLLLLILIIIYKPLKTKVFSLIHFFAAFLLLITSVMSGSKFIVIFYVLLVSLFYHYYIKKLKFSHIAAIGMLLYPYSVMISHVRNKVNLLEMLQVARELLVFDISYLLPFRSGELIVPQNLMMIMYDIDMGNISLSYGVTWFTDLMVFIPKFLFPNRPLPLSEIFANYYFPDKYQQGFGFGNFILMDGYYAFGILGVIIIMFCYGALVGVTYKLYEKNRRNGLFTFLYAILYMNLVVNAPRTGFFLSIKSTLIIMFPFLLILYLSRENRQIPLK